jgi:hypothetical protein
MFAVLERLFRGAFAVSLHLEIRNSGTTAKRTQMGVIENLEFVISKGA